MTIVSGDRAAQSNDRARPGGRLMPLGRARPGLGDPSRSAGPAACVQAGLVAGVFVLGVSPASALASKW